ncbi:MAG: anthranilate phosphoribosyltransferase [Candidatus Spyradenecus sp.]
MFKEAFEAVLARQDLPEETMGALLEELLAGQVDPVAFGGFLVAVRMKGVARSELTGAARFLLRHAVPIDTGLQPVVDMVGTGGDGGASFNISTTAAFVAAGAGVPMAKHGNRAVSGKSGAADVLAACGFNLECSPAAMERAIRELGIGFLFAQKLHPAFAKVGPMRRALGTRTLFNLLGPLVNPAHASAAVIGVYNAADTELIAGALQDLGMRRALVVHGQDGLDELTVTTATRLTELDSEGNLRTYELYPELLLGQRYPQRDLRGGTPAENAAILRAILEGREHGGARAVVALNAGAAIYISGRAESLAEGYARACEAIDSGAALAKLEALVEMSRGA